MVFVLEWLDIRLLLVFIKTLENTLGSLMSLMVYTLKKTREEKNMRKLTKKSQFWVIRVLVEKKIAEPQGVLSSTFSIDTCDIVNSPLFTVAIIKSHC